MKYIVVAIFSKIDAILETKAQPILCSDIGCVYEAIKECRIHGATGWSVWEVINGKAESCEVINPYDMQRIYVFLHSDKVRQIKSCPVK